MRNWMGKKIVTNIKIKVTIKKETQKNVSSGSGLHTIIRDKTTKREDFIFYSDRLIRLLIEEGLRCVLAPEERSLPAVSWACKGAHLRLVAWCMWQLSPFPREDGDHTHRSSVQGSRMGRVPLRCVHRASGREYGSGYAGRHLHRKAKRNSSSDNQVSERWPSRYASARF